MKAGWFTALFLVLVLQRTSPISAAETVDDAGLKLKEELAKIVKQ